MRRLIVAAFGIACAIGIACGGDDDAGGGAAPDGGGASSSGGSSGAASSSGGSSSGGADANVTPDPEPGAFITSLGRGEVMAAAFDPASNAVVASGYDYLSTGSAFLAKVDRTGNVLWRKEYKLTSESSSATTVAVDAQSNVFVTGNIGAPFDFGKGEVPKGTYLAKYDAAGNLVFAKTLGTTTSVDNLRTTPSGHLFVLADVLGDADYGGGAIGSTTMWRGVVLHLDANGGYVAQKLIVGNGHVYPYGLALEANGGVFVGGMYDGSIDLGAGSQTGPLFESGTHWGFLVHLDATLNPVKGKTYQGAPISDVALDAAGSKLLFCGGFSGTTDFGGGSVMTTGSASDAYVTEVDTQLGYQWSKRWGDTGDQSARAVAFDPDGRVVVIGSGTSGFDLGGGKTADAGASEQVYAARLDPSSAPLALVIAKPAGASYGASRARTGVAIGRGEAVIGGWFNLSIALGAQSLESDSGSGQISFVARFGL